MLHKFLLFIAIILLFAASCKKNVDASLDQHGIAFTSSIEGITTRASGTTWDADDAIGVFAKNSSGATVDANKKYTTTGNGNFTATGADAINYPADGSSLSFSAYYPYNAAATNTLDVNVAMQASPAAIDLMYASNTTGYNKNSSTTPNLNFTHQLSKVELIIKPGTGVASLAGVTADFQDFNTQASFNLGTGILSAGSTPATIAAHMQTSGADPLATALMLPVADAGGKTVLFKLPSGDSYVLTLPAGTKFESGKKYTYTVSLQGPANTVMLRAAVVTPWTEVPGGDITAPSVNTPSPLGLGDNTQEFNEVLEGFAENKRAGLPGTWSDFSPTGFYLLPGDTLKLTVTQLAGAALPKLFIGTFSRDTMRLDPRTVTLTAGLNTITDNVGGMLWIRYITTGTPSAKARITFNSGAVRVPVFVKNQTTNWPVQLATYTQAPDALLVNNNLYVVWTRSRAAGTSAADANFILQTIDKGIDQGENYISGYDGSAPEHIRPVHKILAVETNRKDVWGVATWYRIVFASGLMDEAMRASTIIRSGWGLWHEVGHMHQQHPWTWSNLGEVTVNLYTLAAERAIGGNGVNRFKGTTTNNALTYLASTDPNKNYNATSGIINDAFVRTMMFHQLWLAFGDAFYIALHKQTRIEKPDFGSRIPENDPARMRYFMLKACTISGKDLTGFFKKWALPVTQSVYDEIAALNLPPPAVDPTRLTDENPTGI